MKASRLESRRGRYRVRYVLGVIWVGTSGWQYADWRGPFYPPRLPQRRWLEHYAATFATVEVNNAFYRLPERTVFSDWRERTPRDFEIAVKASRYLTHIRRLHDPAEPVGRFMERVEALGDRLGPVLLQLPPNLRAEPAALAETLDRFPDGVRVAVEPRHESWWCEEVRALLAEHGAALCWADRAGRPVTPLWRTADFGYLRLHEGRASPHPRYGAASLATWLDRINNAFRVEGIPGDGPNREDVYVYFNNDHGGAAVADAIAFARRAARRGYEVSRCVAAQP